MSGDLSTEKVMDWLHFYEHPFLRINLQDFLDNNASFSLFPPEFTIRDCHVEANRINAVWYRRTGAFERSDFYKNHQKHLVSETAEFLNREYTTLKNSFAALFPNAYWLNHPLSASVNKIQVLHKAHRCGLSVPLTYVVNSRTQLLTLLRQRSLICKSVYESMVLKIGAATYMMYTEELTLDIAEGLGEQFYPSMVQEKIEKAYEVRVFYLDGKFYAMAIFSQLDAQTKLDFRQYNDDKPNRNVLYKLSDELQRNLHRLMQALDLNCGSIDLIRGADGKYYFLEVNPVGQYGMTSDPCNYNLDQLIAEHLIEKDLTYGKNKVS